MPGPPYYSSIIGMRRRIYLNFDFGTIGLSFMFMLIPPCLSLLLLLLPLLLSFLPIFDFITPPSLFFNNNCNIKRNTEGLLLLFLLSLLYLVFLLFLL